MGKLSYDFSPATQYKNGYALGYKNGKRDSTNATIQITLETIVMLLHDAEWSEDDIQEFADRLTRGIVYNCNHPTEWKELVDQAKKDGLTINFEAEKV